jgi:predicted dinucleotide-binding enzyme
MHIQETIVLIGTGKNGRLAAVSLQACRYQLLLCDKNFIQARELAQELNSTACGCVAEAMECSFNCAWEADIIILTPDFEEQLEVARYIKAVANQKLLISVYDDSNSNSGDEGISSTQQIDLIRDILPNTKIALIKFATARCDKGLKTNAIENIEIYSREQNTLDTVAGIFKNSGVENVKKELLSLTPNMLQPESIDPKC